MIAATRDVYKIYQEDGIETVALRGISLSLCEGEIVAVVGPSGSGKSTLIGILGGTIRPTSGEVYWSTCEDDISKLSPEAIIKLRRGLVGFISQEENLFDSLTVLQNVELPARILGMPCSKARTMGLLERVGLDNRAKFVPGMLSSGERKRVEIASALITNPKMVLADEPTGNLDFSTSEDVLELFRELNEESHSSFFIVTHSQQVASIADKVYEIKDGMFVGSHIHNVDVKNLDKSRIINLDSFGRLIIPSYLLSQIGNPSTFHAKVHEGSIILTPGEATLTKPPVIVLCRLCGRAIKERRMTCPYCGVALEK